MLINIRDIKIKKRIRQDLGDLGPLMESLREYGLIHPVAVNRKHELIAGHRRLESARRLGWEQIEATVLDAAGELGMLELELGENVLRLDFTRDELASARKRLQKLRNPGFFRRLWIRLKKMISGF